ncbi:putative heterokaryon incompatibility protein [Neurospora tetraspora]|uniref:Heterokaryon incompatibility protein n=1 Tax=Neurospora tetraspora TaxID=94610 RepID=A0AAE0J8T2_9PEZI|nr:putative heterokaryon incompatibility protein [Neurospora tetraspora]
MSTVQIPPGGTYLDTLKRSFTDVPVQADKENAIPTTEFLEAAESLVSIFDVLGSTAFSPVKSDMLGNVEKIRQRFLATPTESETLQDLVNNEQKAKQNKAGQALLWLVRGLEFTCKGLANNVAAADQELSTSFRAAYDVTLKPHHSFLIKPIFSAAMSACPYRTDFYSKLGDDQDKVNAQLKEYLAALENFVNILKAFLDSKGIKK